MSLGQRVELSEALRGELQGVVRQVVQDLRRFAREQADLGLAEQAADVRVTAERLAAVSDWRAPSYAAVPARMLVPLVCELGVARGVLGDAVLEALRVEVRLAADAAENAPLAAALQREHADRLQALRERAAALKETVYSACIAAGREGGA